MGFNLLNKLSGPYDKVSMISVGLIVFLGTNRFFFMSIVPFCFIISAFGAYIMYARKLKVHRQLLIVHLFILLIQIGQLLSTDQLVILPIKTILGTHLRILTSYILLRLIKDDYFLILARFIYIMTIVSLYFYVLCELFPSIPVFFIKNITPFFKSPFAPSYSSQTIIIYNFASLRLEELFGLGRNSGCFWEPGVFAIFLNIAIIINSFVFKKIFVKKNIVMILALFTTFSTTGYVVFVFFIILYMLVGFNGQFKYLSSIFVLPIVIVLISFMVKNLEFIGEKVQTSLVAENNSSRFYNFKVDFEEALEHPFFGAGKNKMLKYDIYDLSELDGRKFHRNNGLGILLSTYGFVVFFLYFFYVYRGAKAFVLKMNIHNIWSFLFLIVFITLNFGEPLATRISMFSFALLFFVKKEIY